MKKISAITLLLCVITVALTGCGQSPSASSNTIPDTVLTVALTNDVGAIVWSASPERQSYIASAAFFDLYFFPADEGKVEPALMEDCNMALDYMTATCNLRRNVVFHNGEPFNADAVIYSFKVMSTAEIPYPFPGEDRVTVEKIDDDTVRFNFKKPYPNFVREVLAASEAIPPKYVEEVGFQAFLEKPVGTGPFVFEEWVKGDRITGKANLNYWREGYPRVWGKGYPKVGKIVFKIIPESADRIKALRAGEVDVITRLTAEEAASLEGDAKIKVIQYPVNRVFYVAFNNLSTGKDTPIIKPEARLAMNYAIDRQALVDDLFEGNARLSTGLVTPGDMGYVDLAPLPYDLEKAKSLLADAGFPDGFKIDMACPDNAYSQINKVCDAIASSLMDVNISVNLEYVESEKFWDMESKQQLPPLFVDSWSATGDPMRRINGSLGKGKSYAAWFDPRIQDLIDRINSTDDLSETNTLYAELTALLRDEPPFIYLYEPFTFEAINARVLNYNPTSNEQFWVSEIGVAETP